MSKHNTEKVYVSENLGLASSFILFVSGLLQTSIFTVLGVKLFREIVAPIGKFLAFPLIIITDGLYSFIKWREAKLNNYKRHLVVAALVETVLFIATSVVIVGAAVSMVLFGALMPIAFTAISALRFLYHTVASCYYGIKAAITPNDGTQDATEKKQYYKNHAKQHIVNAGLSLVGTVITGLVMIFAKFVFAAVGAVLGVLGTVFAGYHLGKYIGNRINARKQKRLEKKLNQEFKIKNRCEQDVRMTQKLPPSCILDNPLERDIDQNKLKIPHMNKQSDHQDSTSKSLKLLELKDGTPVANCKQLLNENGINKLKSNNNNKPIKYAYGKSVLNVHQKFAAMSKPSNKIGNQAFSHNSIGNQSS